jgi:hypothetical protein
VASCKSGNVRQAARLPDEQRADGGVVARRCPLCASALERRVGCSCMSYALGGNGEGDVGRVQRVVAVHHCSGARGCLFGSAAA